MAVRIKQLFLVLLVLVFFSCKDEISNNPVSGYTTGGAESFLDIKIGQMLLIGFRGLDVSDTSMIIKDIKAGRIGGVVLYDRDVALNSAIRNIESEHQLRELIKKLKSKAAIPLFISIDQEGGRVARLKEKYGFPSTVSQQYLGEVNNSDTTEFYYDRTASVLRKLGINVNYAPVVDLNVNPESPAIGKIGRSFSDNPDKVVYHSLIAINSHHKMNIFTALKHFPGHGSASADSHLGFTDVTNTWSDEELEPYRRMIKFGYNDLIMTAHIFNSKLDPDYPATLSKKIITGILREQLGFQGVVITDDMGMGAITNYYGLETAVQKSIEAGADIFLFANNIVYDEMIAVKVRAIVKELIAKGIITEKRIDESYQRIMKLKNKLKYI